jgi:hypothetical protein
MPAIGIPLLALAGAAVAFWASLEVGFCVVLAFWLLVPGNLAVVGLPHIVLVDRFVLYTFALRLVLRHNREGEPPGSAYRLTAMHAVLAILLVVGYVDGVVVAQRGLSLASNLDTWIYTLDVVVVFVVGLAVIRTVGARRVAGPIVVLVSVAAVIGIIERFTGSGWSGFFFEHLPSNYMAPGAGGLQTRAGHVRSQAASQFALEFGWVLTILLPLVMVTAFRWARGTARLAKAAYVLPVLVAVAVALAASRSAEVLVAVGIVLVTVLAGFPRRFIMAMVVAGAAVVVVAVADPSLIGASFTSASHTNSISVRAQRLPDVFAFVVQRPFTGIGYSGLSSTVPGLDNAYALQYVSLGVIGVAAWVALLVTAAVTALRSLAAPRNTWVRDLGAATVVGIIFIAIASAAYDVTSTPQTLWTFALLAALAVALKEAVPVRAPNRVEVRPQRKRALRLVLPLVGVGAGFVMLAAAPLSSSETFAVFTDSPSELAVATQPPGPYAAELLTNTLCDYLNSPDRVLPGSTLRCEQLSVVQPAAWPNEATVRIGASTPGAVRAEYRRSLAGLAPAVVPVVTAQGTVNTGKPAWATTAPLWVGLVGLGLALFVPPIRLRRRRRVVSGFPSHRRTDSPSDGPTAVATLEASAAH